MEMKRETTLAVEAELLGIAIARSARDILEELGTSCAGTQDNDDSEVHGGEEPHETIEDVNSVISLGEKLARTPWGNNALLNRGYYIVDTGHVVTVKPKNEESKDDDAIKRCDRYLKQWMTENCWSERQTEVCHRLDKHGEVLDVVFYDPDEGEGLKVSFAEPVDMEEDADSPYMNLVDSDKEFVDELGVRRTNNILYRPVAYFIDGKWYDDFVYRTKGDALAEVPDNRVLVQHRKRNVLSSAQRGLNLYWTVREEITWAKKLLANLMRVSSFQAAFGAIRSISNMFGTDATKGYLNSQQTGAIGASASEKYDFPSPAVVTVPEAIKYDFPETGAGNSNHIEVLLNLLRAAASGMNLPEFILTANVSEGNFASTLVSEGPFHKAMRKEQAQMVKEDLRILYQVLRFAASKGLGDITDEDVDSVILEVKPPRVQTRNRKEDYETNIDMWQKGLLSGKSVDAAEDRDFEAEQAQIEIERKTEHPAPLAVTGPLDPASVPGPKQGMKADQMAEKGVLAGEPKDTPES